MDIDLRVNDAAFALSETPDERKLREAGFKRGGMFVRRAVQAEKDAVVYGAKNCVVTCFGGAYTMRPNLESMDQRCSTAAYLVYAGNALQRVQLELTGNLTQAKIARRLFLSTCEETKGWPLTSESDPRIHQMEDERAHLSCEMHPSGEHVYVTWEVRG